MGVFTYFPLLAVPVVVYNLMAWGGSVFGGAGTVIQRLSEPLFHIPMASATTTTNAAGEVMTQRTEWALTPGDLLLSLALLLLFIELLKSTSTGRSAIANHALSLIIFIICMIEFLLFAPFATSVFFLITVMALLDVLAGFIVTIVTARRDIAVGEGFE
ncbi:MAG: hypothetical protein GWO02_05565 [Gammaproteobacteria bacterium]|nr:hypothetical protein [Gammaproteobacteria bacterium]